MKLRDIDHTSNALSLLEQARQELLQQGSDAICNYAEAIEHLYSEILTTMEKETGIQWSND